MEIRFLEPSPGRSLHHHLPITQKGRKGAVLTCGAKLDPLVIQDSYGYKLKPHENP